jgi:hypothetical protein
VKTPGPIVIIGPSVARGVARQVIEPLARANASADLEAGIVAIREAVTSAGAMAVAP